MAPFAAFIACCRVSQIAKGHIITTIGDNRPGGSELGT